MDSVDGSAAMPVAVLVLAVLAAAPAPSLCAPDEVVAFTCALPKKKVASLCASKDAGPTTGYVQYRFGSKKKVELTFPAPKEPAAQHFLGREVHWTKGGATSLRFSSGRFAYLVYTGANNDWHWSGVVVFKGSQVVRRLACVDADDVFIPYDWLKTLSLPEDRQEYWVPGT
jgi:hypothetical protein